ncbi:SGNH/GDSL hydrolase family protein [Lacticaseibacillus suihuaensis]
MKRAFASILLIVALVVATGALALAGHRRQAAQLAQQTAAYQSNRTAHPAAAAAAKTATTTTTAKAGEKVATKAATARAKKLKAVGQGQSLSVAVMGSDIATGKDPAGFQYGVRDYLSKTLGYDVTLSGNWAAGATIGGTGLSQLATVAAKAPALLIIAYGTAEQDSTNNFYAQPDTLRANLAMLLSRAKTALPDTRVVVLTSWRHGTDGAAYDAVIKTAAQAAGAQVVDLTTVWQAAANQTAANQPTEAGQQAIAQAVIKQALVKAYVPKALQ